MDLQYFKDYFGENRVDIIETTNTGTSVYIWFPKETISNSKGQKHTIYDLYIEVKFVNSVFMDMHTIRTSFTLAELHSGYSHSHSPSRPYAQAGDTVSRYAEERSCCLGTGPLNQLMGDYIDSNILMSLCIYIEKWVRWESLEGGPYVRMEQIGNIGLNTSSFLPSLPSLKALLESCYIPKSLIQNLNWGVVKKEYKILNPIEYFMLGIIIPSEKYYTYRLYPSGIIGSNVDIYKSLRAAVKQWDLSHTCFWFKGAEIPMKIVDAAEQESYTLLKNTNFRIACAIKIILEDIVNAQVNDSVFRLEKKGNTYTIKVLD